MLPAIAPHNIMGTGFLIFCCFPKASNKSITGSATINLINMLCIIDSEELIATKIEEAISIVMQATVPAALHKAALEFLFCLSWILNK